MATQPAIELSGRSGECEIHTNANMANQAGQAIPRVAATRCNIPELRTDINSFHAQRDSDGQQYYVKTRACRNRRGEENPTWLGNELIYYLIASRSQLQMPFSAIIELEGKFYWGSEYIQGRNALPRDERESTKLLRRICEQSKDELLGLARALLLDVALLNSDRTPSNILTSNGTKLWFFDHEKSLLGDGREPTDTPPGDLGRIEDASVTNDKVGDYLKCAAANKLVLECLSDQEIRDVHSQLALNSDSLDAARADCPKVWVSDEHFSRLRCFLLRWWEYVRPQLTGKAPRCYLTHALLKRSPE